ncbi:MAG: NAD(P)H-binding protein [Labrenzia sp.]
MKIAVTAVSGHLGRAILDAAVSRNGSENCVGLCRTPSKVHIEGVDIRPGDYGQPAQLETSLKGVDVVLLVSGNDAPEKRIGQHRNVIEAAKKVGVQKIVYTSVQGAEEGTKFAPVVKSNRQTESDIRACGLAWAIGRNGIYIEPDIEYVDTYVKAGEVANCAGEGKCGYTTRLELAAAYANLLVDPSLDGHTYNLNGDALTQRELVALLNEAMNVELNYRPMTEIDFQRERTAELGEFLGNIITGIYSGIRNGYFDNESQFEAASGRPHQSWKDYFAELNRSSSEK